MNRFTLVAAGLVLTALAASASAQMMNTPGPSGTTPSADVTIHPAGSASGSQKAAQDKGGDAKHADVEARIIKPSTRGPRS